MCFFPWVFSCHQIQTTNPEFCDSTKENKKTYLHDETCHLLFSWSSWTRRLSSANALIQRCLICADLATMRNHLLRLLSCILMAFLTLTLYCGSAMKQEYSTVKLSFSIKTFWLWPPLSYHPKFYHRCIWLYKHHPYYNYLPKPIYNQWLHDEYMK